MHRDGKNLTLWISLFAIKYFVVLNFQVCHLMILHYSIDMSGIFVHLIVTILSTKLSASSEYLVHVK